jgi:prepilin-type N-terminal cleavage/methylation domain-containing protein
MSARLRQARYDGGFTLPELLLALAISLIIALAAFTLLDVVVRRAGEIDQRVDTSQRGRMLMDVVTRELRSQVCMSQDTPPIYETTSGTVGSSYQQTVSFYTDLTDGRANTMPQLRTLRYDDAAQTITEDTVTPVGTTYNLASATSRVIATNVVREIRTNPDGSTTTLPIFQYYAFTASADPSLPAQPTLALPLAMAKDSDDAEKVARIVVNFEALPLGKTTVSRTATVFQDEIYVRAADPNNPAPMPTCLS